jgi:HEAT repeat protein
VASERDALNGEKNPDVQRALIRALTRSGGSSAETMSGLLDSKDARVREAAVQALAGRGSSNPWPWPEPRPRPRPHPRPRPWP